MAHLHQAIACPLLAFTLTALTELAAAAPVAVKVRQFVQQPGDSVQGMAITTDGHLLQGYDGGRCRVYDLNDPADMPIAEFRFASAGKDNHANALSLGEHYQGGAFPLLYISGGQPGNGVMECHVENILKTATGYRAERVQRITLAPEFAWDMQLGSPFKTADGFYKIWGAPSWLVDPREKCLYVFSAIYRTTKAYARFKDANRYIVTKLRLPAVSEGDVTLTRQDVQAQTVCDFDVFVTQSGCLHEGELYYAFGFGRPRGQIGESQIRAYDLKTGRITRRFDLTEEIPEELEACAFYQGELHVMTQKGNLYKMKLFP